MPQLVFRTKYVWFPIHLKGPMIPEPSGHLAELIVYITSTRVDLYTHQILLCAKKLSLDKVPHGWSFHYLLVNQVFIRIVNKQWLTGNYRVDIVDAKHSKMIDYLIFEALKH